jgi:hypothetical protein
MRHRRRTLTGKEFNGRCRWWGPLAAVAAVVVIAGCHREPQTALPESAPAGTATTGSSPLPSWNDGASRRAIVDFVARVTRGDFEMLEWVTSGPGPRLGAIVHHTDAAREWAYDRGSSIGRLERGLDEAAARRWVVVDMKHDWKQIYPDEAKQ